MGFTPPFCYAFRNFAGCGAYQFVPAVNCEFDLCLRSDSVWIDGAHRWHYDAVSQMNGRSGPISSAPR